MPYSEPEIAVLKKYRIMTPEGAIRNVNLLQPDRAGAEPPGPGPLISPDVIDRLLAADTTPDRRWLDWIFFQAGGGQAAVAMTSEAIVKIRERFIDERVNGWTHPDTGRHLPAVPREQAEQRWVRAEPRFREVLAVGDQDAVKKLRTFGYFRDWPGNANKYASTVEAITNYLRLYPRLQEMNAELDREGLPKMSETPEAISTWEDMAKIATKVERYFAARKARTDIRIADNKPIYSDDNLTVMAPLTYGAAVRFGHEMWPWANRANFERVLSGEPGGWQDRDEWKEHTKNDNVIVYMHFSAPVPAQVIRRGGGWQLFDLVDLALKLNKAVAQNNPDEWVVYDQENRNILTVAQIKQMILAEPTRVDTEDEMRMPKMRGGNVYATAAEAQAVVKSLDQAVHAVQQWIANFNVKKIRTDVMKLD